MTTEQFNELWNHVRVIENLVLDNPYLTSRFKRVVGLEISKIKIMIEPEVTRKD